MYINNKTILTTIVYVVLIAAVVVGLLFAFGVLGDKNSTKLPITYPDKNIDWVMSEDGTLRASFGDNLKITQDEIVLKFAINDSEDSSTALRLVDETDSTYKTYEAKPVSFHGDSENDTLITYSITIRLYIDATLTDNGDLITGDGFVVEFADLQKYDDDTSAYVDVDIESLKILAMYESADNVAILK